MKLEYKANSINSISKTFLLMSGLPVITGPILLCAECPSQVESQEIFYKNYKGRNTDVYV